MFTLGLAILFSVLLISTFFQFITLSFVVDVTICKKQLFVFSFLKVTPFRIIS